MKKKKKPFDNQLATRLMTQFHEHDLHHDKTCRCAACRYNCKLRNRIAEMVLPLIDAAISKKYLYLFRDELKQECSLKILTAIPKYDCERGDPFGFFWTVICNTCLTHSERLNRPNYSISSDLAVQKEAEVSGKSVFQTPENQHILLAIGNDLTSALAAHHFQAPAKVRHQRACRLIQDSIASGELFFDKNKTMHKLRHLGLNKKEIQYYCQYSLIVVREKLLSARENASAINRSEINKDIPTLPVI